MDKVGRLPVLSRLQLGVRCLAPLSCYVCFLLLNGLLCVVVGWLDGTARGVAGRPPAGGGRAP